MRLHAATFGAALAAGMTVLAGGGGCNRSTDARPGVDAHGALIDAVAMDERGATGGHGGGSGSGGADGTGAGGAGSGGADGGVVPPGVSYTGCTFIGGLDRVVIAKRDTTRNLCVTLVLANGTAAPPFTNLSLPQFYRVELAAEWPDTSNCTTRVAPAGSTAATGGSGTATFNGTPPAATVTVDVTLLFPADAGSPSERLQAASVDVSPGCI